MRVFVTTLVLAACSLVLLGACASGGSGASAPPGSYLVVLNKSESTVQIVEPNSGHTRDRAATGEGPHEAAASADGSIAVIANYGAREPGHTLSVWGFPERRVIATIDLAPHGRPHGIAFVDRRSTVLVTSESSRAVLEVEVRARKVRRVLDTGADGSHMLAISPDRSRVFTANLGGGSVSAIDLEDGRLLEVVPTGREAEAIDVSPDGREVWVGNRAEDTLTVLDARTLARTATIPCGRMPIRLKFTPDGRRVLVACAASNEVAVLDARARSEVARIPMPGENATPIGLVVEPRGRFAYAACSGARGVAVLDLSALSVSGRIEAGEGPDGMAWSRQLQRFRFLGDDPDQDDPF